MKESQNIEFKKNWRDEYLKTVCAFANSSGGMFYLGVANDGSPVGLKNIENLMESLPHKIKNHLNIIPSVKVENIEGKNVLKIEVGPSDVPISYKGRFYIRSGSTTQEVSGTELIRFIMKRQKLSWDILPSEAGLEDVDRETVEEFKQMAKRRLSISDRDSVRKILENLELLQNGKLTNAGILLFGKNPQRYIISSVARVGRFKSPIDILDTVEVKENLFKQVEGLMEAIKKHLNVRFEIKGLERKDMWDYPLEAVREACINALIHRDYMDTADIQIKIYDDHIWFWNPGKLPEGITVEMLRGEHLSKPRNKLLAMVFYYAGLIEKWGTGTKRMVELCKTQGLPEPEFKEFGYGFSVIFWKDIYNETHLRKLGLNERQIKAVMYVKEKGWITVSEFKSLVPDVAEKTLYRELKDLVEKKVLVEKGEKKGRKYVLP